VARRARRRIEQEFAIETVARQVLEFYTERIAARAGPEAHGRTFRESRTHVRRRRRRRAAGRLPPAAAALAVGGGGAGRARPLPAGGREGLHRNDFERYYWAGHGARHGLDIYRFDARDDRQFKYAPVFAQLMTPLVCSRSCTCPRPMLGRAHVEQVRFAAGLWYWVLCLSYFGALALAILMARPADGRARPLPARRRWRCRFGSSWTMVRLGQINMPVMFLPCSVAG